MALVEELSKLTCRILVDIGQTSTGNVKTANVNLPFVSKDGYTAAAFNALSVLIEPVLNYSVYDNQAVKTYSVHEE